MPVWLVLAVVGGVVMGLLLAMVIGFHLIESNAPKHCVHISQQRKEDSGTLVSEPGQLCCLCGNVRKRRAQALKTSGTTEAKESTGILQPFMDAACGKSPSRSMRVRCLGSRTSLRTGIVSGLQGGWFNAGFFFRGPGKGVRPNAKGGDTQSPAISAASTANAEISSAGSTGSGFASGSGPGSTTTITTTITTTTSTSSASAPTSCGVSSSGTEEGTTKQLPQRRLVLEILMSPSGDGQGGALPRATGVRLKLETNASLDSLASLAAAASSGVEDSTAQGPAETATGTAFAADLTSTTFGAIPSTETSSNVSNGHSGPSSRGLKSVCYITRQGTSQKGDCCTPVGTLQVVDAGMNSSGTRANTTAGTADEMEYFHVRAIGGATGNGGAVGHKSAGLATPSTFSFASSSAKSKPSSHSTAGSKSKLKGGCSPVQCPSPSLSSNGLSALSTASACSVNLAGQSLGTSRVPVSHHILASSSLDGLGSLRISLVEAGSKGKSVKECTKGVTADIASALAALNVDSIGGKGVGMGSGIVNGVMLTETGKVGSSEGPCSKASVDFLLDEDAIGEGSGSEQGMEESEEHQLVGLGLKRGQGCDEDDADGKKKEKEKEKKKKKNRGRRHKAKVAAAVAAASGDVLTDRKESEKLAIEHGEPHIAVLSSEVEVGCLCGTSKGGFHSSTCPYPFTCSGSMVQRKIKEQYDELVRSNVAKTLTLAQVGRFTTCLVEAKSALQHKSDTIQRRFTIAKSLLAKADKSSFDRLCGQIYGLEIEQKKLEEDTVVYNRLQEQLKLSPAYLKMLEYGRAHFELQPNTGQLIEKVDTDDEEISFEELLAQEKKDSFWQKHGPSRSSVQVS